MEQETALDMLMAQQTATNRAFDALLIALHQAGAVKIADVLTIMELMRTNIEMTETPTAARCMGFMIDRLKAFADPGTTPLELLVLQTVRYAQTDPDLRAALTTWTATATTDEIADELSDLLGDAGKRPASGQGEPAPSGE